MFFCKNNKNKLKMEQFCRICTGNNITLVNIFAMQDQLEDEPPLADMLNDCTNCGIGQNDPLPQNICLTCILAAQASFRFKRKCEQSQQYFWQLLSHNEQKFDCEILIPEDIPEDWPVDQLECTQDVGGIKKEHSESSVQEQSVDEENVDDSTSGTSGKQLYLNRRLHKRKSNIGNSMGLKEEESSVDEENFDDSAISLRVTDSEKPVDKSSSKEKRHICQTCGKGFVYNKDLKVHLRVHTGERPYKCDHCPKAFISLGGRNIHMRLHTGECPFKCHQCAAKFSRNDDLKRHLLLHTGERPHKCPHCTKTFTKRSVLTRHLRYLHSDKHTHICPHCMKRFRNSFTLEAHVRTHTGERPYKCSNCSKSYTKLGYLRKHSIVHADEP